MTDRVVLICPNAIAREGLSRIIAASNFTIVSAGPAVGDIDWAACDDTILTVIDVGNAARRADLVQEVHGYQPAARCVVLVDEFDYNEMVECFEKSAQGYIVKDMPISPLMASLHLASMGERILPANLLDVVLGHSIPPAAPNLTSPADDANLSQREMDVLCCLTAGYPNKLIARELEVSEATVKVHVKAILRKLKVGNRTQAAMWGTTRGITTNTPLATLN